MAHFAQLDENNQVINVIVIDNQDIIDHETNLEDENLGVKICKQIFGDDTTWKQTSYNKSIRKHFAGVGFSYDPIKDAFIPPQPYESWIFDEETCTWNAPNRPALTYVTPAGETLSEPVAARSVWDEDLYNSTGNGWRVLDDIVVTEKTTTD